MGPNSISFLDLSISESDFKEGAKQILKHVRPSWKLEDIQFKVFTDGITNKLLGCSLPPTSHDGQEDEADTVLVRINGQGTEVIINRQEEQETFSLLSRAGLAPPVYCVFSNGMAYGFIPGSPLDETSVRLPIVQRLIAEEMVRLHRVQSSDADSTHGAPACQLRARLQSLLDTTPRQFEDPTKQQLFVSTIPSLHQLQEEINSVMSELEVLGMESVFSHNDLLLKNIIYNERKGRIHFIDFEYAFYNYEAFDIANHFAEYAGMDEVDYDLYPAKKEQLPWLQHYLQCKVEAEGRDKDSVTDREVERLYVQTNKSVCASHLFWGIWALIQAKHSTIDFDYISYANIRLTEYFRRKEEFFPLQLPS